MFLGERRAGGNGLRSLGRQRRRDPRKLPLPAFVGWLWPVSQAPGLRALIARPCAGRSVNSNRSNTARHVCARANITGSRTRTPGLASPGLTQATRREARGERQLPPSAAYEVSVDKERRPSRCPAAGLRAGSNWAELRSLAAPKQQTGKRWRGFRQRQRTTPQWALALAVLSLWLTRAPPEGRWPCAKSRRTAQPWAAASLATSWAQLFRA